jgi:hypothetical protein
VGAEPPDEGGRDEHRLARAHSPDGRGAVDVELELERPGERHPDPVAIDLVDR